MPHSPTTIFRRARARFVGAVLLSVLLAPHASAQTWRTINSVFWSDPTNWGGVLPTNDGTADITFSQIGNPGKLRGTTTLDRDWNIRSIHWNPTSLDSGKALIRRSNNKILTLQSGVTNASGGRVEIYSDVVLGALQTWEDSSSSPHGDGTYVAGQVSGPGGILKTGAGTLTLDATSNSYSGGTKISGGVLKVRGPAGLGSGDVSIGGGALSFGSVNAATPRDFVLGSGGGKFMIYNATLSLSGGITGLGSLQLAAGDAYSPGRYAFSAANSYSGGTFLASATARLIGADAKLGTADITLESASVLELATATNLHPGQKVALQPGTALVLNDASIDPLDAIVSDPARTTGGMLALNAPVWTRPLDMAQLGNGRLALGSSSDVAYTANWLGAGADGVYRLGGATSHLMETTKLAFRRADNLFTGDRRVEVVKGAASTGSRGDVSDNCTVVLGRSNDYTGGTLLLGGTLMVEHDAALGSGPVSFRGGNFMTGAGPRVLPNAVLFDAPTASPSSVSGYYPLAIDGSVDLGQQRHSWLNWNQSGASLNNVVSRGTLVLTAGRWFLHAVNTATFEINSASVVVSTDAALGSAATPLVFTGNDAVLRTSASFTTARAFDFTNANNPGIYTAGQTLTLTGSVRGDFEKGDAGTLVLSGAGPFQAKPTIRGGTLFLDTGSATIAAPVVMADATLTGAGAIRLQGLSAASGGRVSPGNPIGSFTAGPVWTFLQSGSVLHLAIGGTDRATQYSYLDAEAAMVWGDLEISLANDFNPAPGDTFTVFTAPAGFGAFVGRSFPVLPGRKTFRLSHTATAAILSVEPIANYQEWTYSRFSIAQQREGSTSGVYADPDRDGLANLAEYFFGTDPRAASSSALTIARIVEQGATYVTLTFPQAWGTSDVSWTVQRATTPDGAWSQVSAAEVGRASGDGSDVVTVKVIAPIDGMASGFYRLKLDPAAPGEPSQRAAAVAPAVRMPIQ